MNPKAVPLSVRHVRGLFIVVTFAIPLAAGCSASKPAAVIVTGAEIDPVQKTALAKLQATLRRDAGKDVKLAAAHKIDSAAAPCIVVGTAKSNAELARVASKHGLAVEGLPPQGFLLKTITEGERPVLIIAGGDSRGVLYGVQEAIDQVITVTPSGDLSFTSCDLTAKPALDFRGTYCLTCWGGCPSYDRAAWEEAIDAMADGGMNRVMFWMDGLFRSQRHPDAFLNKPGQHFAKTKLTNDDIHKLIRFAHDRGMDFYFGSGVFGWFTAGEYIAKQFKEAADTTGGALCASSPVAQKVELEYLSEMIEVFPEADGYMLEIRDEMDDCLCKVCQKKLDERGSKQFGQSEMDFLEKLTATVWKGHPKTKFIWLMGYANHNEDVMYYERLRKIGQDPRMEWLEVRMSWTLPSPDGGRKPLRDFSDRIYHWDAYYRFPPDAMQGRVRQTVKEGLHGYLPAYEPGYANLSVYDPQSETPFPVRLIPFCVTQFYYRTFTWNPKITQREWLDRAYRKFFTSEVPHRFADDLLFLRQFMAEHHVELTHSIGRGLGPDGSGLIATVEDLWTVPRKHGGRTEDQTKQWLMEAVGADIRRFQSLVKGTGDMARLNNMEKRIAEVRPTASGRSRASMDIMQRAIDDIRKEVAKCTDYEKEADEAMRRLNGYLKELEARAATQPAGEKN